VVGSASPPASAIFRGLSSSSSLRAPIAISVEVRVPGADPRRVFRLTRNIGADGIRFERPVPFEVGRPVEVAFTLPDAATRWSLRAEVGLCDDDGGGEQGGRALTFLLESTPREAREALHRYVVERLGLAVAV
jgi:hypothetical protein